jgi:hypothetical protein
MAGLFASLLLLCSTTAHGGAATARRCPLRLAHLALGPLPLALAMPEPAPLQGQLRQGVQAVLRGVQLFGGAPGAVAAQGATFQLRPHFGSKGPEAVLDVHF